MVFQPEIAAVVASGIRIECMDLTVDLDNKPGARTEEVDDEWTDGCCRRNLRFATPRRRSAIQSFTSGGVSSLRSCLARSTERCSG